MSKDIEVFGQKSKIKNIDRANQKKQKPKVLWFTGISGSGKSTLANALDERLTIDGKHCYILDGDNMRSGLCSDLDFSDSSRDENIRRVAETARLMFNAGLIVIVATISPFKRHRDFARSLFPSGDFYEVYINASFEDCSKRDPKGLYKKAKSGKVENFTGKTSSYEIPVNPYLNIKTHSQSIKEAVEEILNFCKKKLI
jgi:adenylylsulfate kinase